MSTRVVVVARLAVVVLILLGFAARVWQLGAQSLWLDEALSVTFASEPLSRLFHTLTYRDLHPPLFYLVLHVWLNLAGRSEFAVRFVALFFGLPAVPATYDLGAALFGSPSERLGRPDDRVPESAVASSARVGPDSAAVSGPSGTPALRPAVYRRAWHTDPDVARGALIGLIGAFLVAFSPFLVYYSQEARMYSGLATFGLLSTYALWKLLATGQRRWFIAYVACTTCLIYTQYFGGLVIGFQAVYLLVTARSVTRASVRRRPAAKMTAPDPWPEARAIRQLGPTATGFLGMAIAGVGFLPWLPFAYLQMQRLFHVPDFWRGELSVTFVVEHLFAAFAFGQFGVVQKSLVVAVLAAALLLAGLGLLVRQALRRGGGELYILAYLFVPLVVLYAVLIENPKFAERYLIMIAPPFYLVLALGLVEWVGWIGRQWGSRPWRMTLVGPVAVTAALVVTSFGQLWQVYYGPGYRKEDNRDATAYIEQHYQPGDVVILMMDPYSFPYYLQRSHPRREIPYAVLQPGNDVEGAANSLNAILAGHRRAWLILWNADWADPTGFARQALNSAYPQQKISQQFTGLSVKLYDIDHPPHFTVRTTPEHPEQVNFGNRLVLLGYDLPRSTVAAGQSGTITLYWKALSSLDHDYIVSLRLTDGRFYYWRHDRRPAADTYPTTSWPVGQVVTGDLIFEVPVGTPPGTYELEVGSYGQGVGSDLNILKDGTIPIGTAARIATITVTRPTTVVDPTKLAVADRQNTTFGGDLRLFGSELSTAKVPPGGTVQVTAWWQALAGNLPSYRVRLTLLSGAYRRAVVEEAPDAGRYPTGAWAKGEIVEDKHAFVVPPDAPAGPARVLLTLIAVNDQANGRTVLQDGQPGGYPSVDLGGVTILARHPILTPPADLGTRVDWRFGQFARLVGFRLSSTTAHPGDHLHLTLYWHALGNSGDVGYTVFAHLIDQHSIIFAQQDHPPDNGANPTSGWIKGEFVRDEYDLAIKPDAAPGPYRIEVGMYNPSTLVRLPVTGPSGQAAGDRVILATVQIY